MLQGGKEKSTFTKVFTKQPEAYLPHITESALVNGDSGHFVHI